MINLKNKNALITGSTRGVGRQIALGLAELGCNIIVHGRIKENCESILKDLEKYGIRTYCVFADLSEESEVKDIVRQVKEFGINVDILINNAGIQTAYHENIWEHSRNEWLKSYKINVIAMYDLCAAFIPDMIKNGFGRIVNVTSRINELPELLPYGCSKWAVDKLTNEIAVNLKDTPVRVNSLDPTWLRTDLGGEFAPNPVESVLPGALDPVLIDNDGPNGENFCAIDRTHKKITESF